MSSPRKEFINFHKGAKKGLPWRFRRIAKSKTFSTFDCHGLEVHAQLEQQTIRDEICMFWFHEFFSSEKYFFSFIILTNFFKVPLPLVGSNYPSQREDIQIDQPVKQIIKQHFEVANNSKPAMDTVSQNLFKNSSRMQFYCPLSKIHELKKNYFGYLQQVSYCFSIYNLYSANKAAYLSFCQKKFVKNSIFT